MNVRSDCRRARSSPSPLSSPASSSSALSSPPPATPSPEPDEYHGVAWYQLPTVRSWRAATQRKEDYRHSPRAITTHSLEKANAPAAAGSPPRALAARQQHQRHTQSYSPYPAPSADKRRRSNKLWVADVVTDEDGEVVRVGKGPWPCPVRGCGQILRGRDVKTWVRHLDSHWSHVFRRYECPHCCMGFSRPESLIRHSAASDRCQGVRHRDLTPHDPCWLNPQYKQCIDLPEKTHPLYKVLQPVFRGALRQSDAQPLEPMFGKSGKDA